MCPNVRREGEERGGEGRGERGGERRENERGRERDMEGLHDKRRSAHV